MITGISPTALVCTDLAIGWQTAFDLSIDMQPIGMSADMRRTWNGRMVNLADPAFRLLEVTISSGDGEQRAPALMKMWPGKTFELVPPTDLDEAIAVGATSCVLQRTPYTGSIRCLDTQGNPVGFSLSSSGNVLTLDEPQALPVRVYYRPVLQLIVTEPWSKVVRETRAEVSWSLKTEEVGG